MNKTVISLSDNIGNDLRTRSFFRRDIERLVKNIGRSLELDFSEIVFISRSVADEICNLLVDYPELTISGMKGDVKLMYELVVRGRTTPREYPHTNVKVYHLKTLKDMQAFFEAI